MSIYPWIRSVAQVVYIHTGSHTYAPTEDGRKAARASLLAIAILPHRIVLLAAPSIHSSSPSSARSATHSCNTVLARIQFDGVRASGPPAPAPAPTSLPINFLHVFLLSADVRMGLKFSTEALGCLAGTTTPLVAADAYLQLSKWIPYGWGHP